MKIQAKRYIQTSSPVLPNSIILASNNTSLPRQKKIDTADCRQVRYTNASASTGKMKAYSIDLREKIVQTYEQGNTSVRKVADKFGVTKSFVQKLLLMKKTEGHLKPRRQGGTIKGELDGYFVQLAAMVEQYPDATLSEYCEYWGTTYNNWVSTSTMCRALQKQQLTLKKRRYVAAGQEQKESKI